MKWAEQAAKHHCWCKAGGTQALLKGKAPIHINMTTSSSFDAVFPLLLPKKLKPIHAIKSELMLFIFKPHLITLYQELIA